MDETKFDAPTIAGRRLQTEEDNLSQLRGYVVRLRADIAVMQSRLRASEAAVIAQDRVVTRLRVTEEQEK